MNFNTFERKFKKENIHDPEVQERINVYRKRFNLSREDYKDIDILKIIRKFRLLGRIYINEFKSGDKKDISDKEDVRYNETADNSE